jgi:hypothetical protein
MTYCRRCHRSHPDNHVHAPYRRNADVIEDYLFLRKSGEHSIRVIAERINIPLNCLYKHLVRAGIR